MARTIARLPTGSRITDHISLGVVCKFFPREKVDPILVSVGKQSQRHRDLPAHVVVYYVIAMALYMQSSCREVLRCLLEGLRWLNPGGIPIRVTGESGISQARSRLGSEALKQLHDSVVQPIATQKTQGVWYRKHRLVSLDGSTLDVADTLANREAFGKPGVSRGEAAYPQIRFVSLLENGTHVLFGTSVDSGKTGEVTLAHEVVLHLKPGMLCLADRGFFGFELWQKATSTGADLLWRAKKNQILLRPKKALEDGSFLAKVYPSWKDRRQDKNSKTVRVIEYRLEGAEDPKETYRLLTTILAPLEAPALELAALYHERWEIETAFDELKTHLRGRQIVLRSKTAELVKQEFYGLLMAHFAIRGLMHEAALQANTDPDVLSFMHSVRVIRRTLPAFHSFPPSAQAGLS